MSFKAKIKQEVELSIIDCCNCGYPVALTADHEDRLRHNGKTFYCPQGHRQWFGKSEADKLREALAEEKQRKENALKRLNESEAARRAEAEAAEKARKELQRKAKRVKNGVCPCCNRSFAALQRHLKNQHPDYQP